MFNFENVAVPSAILTAVQMRFSRLESNLHVLRLFLTSEINFSVIFPSVSGHVGIKAEGLLVAT
jgi:hypothetical protein